MRNDSKQEKNPETERGEEYESYGRKSEDGGEKIRARQRDNRGGYLAAAPYFLLPHSVRYIFSAALQYRGRCYSGTLCRQGGPGGSWRQHGNADQPSGRLFRGTLIRSYSNHRAVLRRRKGEACQRGGSHGHCLFPGLRCGTDADRYFLFTDCSACHGDTRGHYELFSVLYQNLLFGNYPQPDLQYGCRNPACSGRFQTSALLPDGQLSDKHCSRPGAGSRT